MPIRNTWQTFRLVPCLLALLASAAPAGELNFASLFDPELVPSDPVRRRSWGGASHLLEQQESSTGGYRLVRRSVPINTSELLIHSEAIVAAFRQLPGFASLSVDELWAFTWSPDEKRLLFYLSDDYFLFDLGTGKAERLTHTSQPKVGAEFSPDGQMLAYIENYNISLVDLATRAVRPITRDGHARLLYGRLDWVYQEEIYGRGDFKGYWWSPDSQSLAFLRIDESGVETYPLVDHMRRYGGLELSSYPKAGRPNPLVTVGLASAGGGPLRWLDLARYSHAPFLVVGVGFTPDSQRLAVQIQDRVQSWLELSLHTIADLTSTLILREESSEWVNRLQEAPVWAGEPGFFWRSERSGYAHLYHYKLDADWQVSQVEQLTSGPWEVRSAVALSEEGDLYFTASKDSLLEDHLYHRKLNAAKLTRLSELGESHRASFDRTAKHFLLYSQTIEHPSRVALYRVEAATPRWLADLYTPDRERLSALGLRKPNFATVFAADGSPMNAFLIRPPDWSPEGHYPVLAHTYSGPHSQLVRNEFGGRRYLWHQYMAKLGYVIWVCDNRSASGNGHVSEALVHQQLGRFELEDLEAGLAGLKALPWIDATRIGIWGWSYGGFQSVYALSHSSTFKMAMAVAPVTDWQLYDSIYTERYMGLPALNPEGYRMASLIEGAEGLRGKSLLLVHGTLDDNVHDQHSLQLAYALEEADIDFELMLYPLSDHGIKHDLHPHLFHKLTNFVLKNL